MWILNLCATLTLFEIYTILGRLGYAANRMSGLITGGCMIPIAFHFQVAESTHSQLALDFRRLRSFPQAQRGMYAKRLMPTFFGLLYVTFLLHYFVRIIQVSDAESTSQTLGFGLFFSLWVVVVAKFSDIGALLVGKAIGRTKMAPSISPKTVEDSSADLRLPQAWEPCCLGLPLTIFQIWWILEPGPSVPGKVRFGVCSSQSLR